eukprot:SAG22_NODE_3338_length_1770_cov_2.400359_1_plen_67_part_10
MNSCEIICVPPGVVSGPTDDKDAFIRQLAARVGELEAWRAGASKKFEEVEQAAGSLGGELEKAAEMA